MVDLKGFCGTIPVMVHHGTSRTPLPVMHLISPRFMIPYRDPHATLKQNKVSADKINSWFCKYDIMPNQSFLTGNPFRDCIVRVARVVIQCKIMLWGLYLCHVGGTGLLLLNRLRCSTLPVSLKCRVP